MSFLPCAELSKLQAFGFVEQMADVLSESEALLNEMSKITNSSQDPVQKLAKNISALEIVAHNQASESKRCVYCVTSFALRDSR